MKYVCGENYLCFYSLMEVILDDIGYDEWSQYSLADRFGVVLPYDYNIKGVNNVKRSDDERMYGAHIDCEMMNEFMEKVGIPLRVTYIASNPYLEYEVDKEYLKNKYCIYTYSYGTLYNEPDKWNVGHASLFLKYIDENQVVIYDPGPREAGEKKVNLYALYEAMYDVRGGFYIFEKMEERMSRCFFSRKEECKAKCKYCFGKWNSYIKFSDIEVINDNTIVYPNCDGDAFDINWVELIEKIRRLSAKNIVVSISTKFTIDDNTIRQLEEVNQVLKEKNGMLKVSVSFSCEKSIEELEENTASYADRIKLIKKLIEREIPYFTIIKPILPFVDFREYKRIVDDTISMSPYYVIGDLYVDTNSSFYDEYVKDTNCIMKQKKVSWNGENGIWTTVIDESLKDRLRAYIEHMGGQVFESDKDAIISMRIQRRKCDE